MEDITLCSGGNCPLKKNCYRYTAEVFGRQDFFGSIPFDFAVNQCAHFLSNITQIQKAAYLLWKEKGSPQGQDEQIWLEAEKQVVKF